MFFRHVKRMVIPARTLFFSNNVSFHRSVAVSNAENKTHAAKELLTVRRQQHLDYFLKDVNDMMHKEAKVLNQTRPLSQIFFSYAWEQRGPALEEQQDFLAKLGVDLKKAGISVWFDLWNMTGAMDPAMRDGINASQFIMLLGMPRYKERVSEPTTTNVRKELNLALKKIENDKDSLLPILWKGDWNSSFPKEIPDGYLVRDWRNSEQYVENLTSLAPLGLLPAALGLNKKEEYYVACRAQYEKHLGTLTLQLERLNTGVGNNISDGVTGIVELQKNVKSKKDIKITGTDIEEATSKVHGEVTVGGEIESDGDVVITGTKVTKHRPR